MPLFMGGGGKSLTQPIKELCYNYEDKCTLEEGKEESVIIGIKHYRQLQQKELILNRNSWFIYISDIDDFDKFFDDPTQRIENLTSNGGEIEIKPKRDTGVIVRVEDLKGSKITFEINISSKVDEGYSTLESLVGGNEYHIVPRDNYSKKGSDIIQVKSKDDKTKIYLKLSNKSVKDLKKYYSIKENNGKAKFFSWNHVVYNFNPLDPEYGEDPLSLKDNKEYIPKETDFGIYSYKPIIRKYYLLRDATEEEKNEFIKGIFELEHFLQDVKEQLNIDTETKYIEEIKGILQELKNLKHKHAGKHYFEIHELLFDKLKKLPIN